MMPTMIILKSKQDVKLVEKVRTINVVSFSNNKMDQIVVYALSLT